MGTGAQRRGGQSGFLGTHLIGQGNVSVIRAVKVQVLCFIVTLFQKLKLSNLLS